MGTETTKLQENWNQILGTQVRFQFIAGNYACLFL